jgi:hypothetical protein
MRWRIGVKAVSHFGHALSHKFNARRKSSDQRQAARRNAGVDGWIRVGFAVRPCRIVDLSDVGVRIFVTSAQTVPRTFALLTSRSAGAGQPAEVRWRRGMELGAKFL